MKISNSFIILIIASILSISNNKIAIGQEEKILLTNIRQLIYEGKRSGEGYFSPDGKKMIFQSEREPNNPFYQIYILDLETGETHRVSPGKGKTTCAFFRPNSQEVLFSSTHLDPLTEKLQAEELAFRASGQKRRYAWDYDTSMDIFSAYQDGSNLRRLTTAKGYDAEAAYSPDGKKIVFSSLRSAYEKELTPEEKKMLEIDPAYFGEVYIMDADGKNQKRLTYWPGYDGGTFFSPDGQRIIWRHFDPTGKTADIYTMKLDGSDIRRITDFNALSWAPYYHPSGKYIIFSSNKLGFSNFELFIVDAEGRKEPVRVTYTEGFDGLPVFSPDGKKLSWTSARTANGAAQIFWADWNHEKALALLEAAPPRTTHTITQSKVTIQTITDQNLTSASSTALENRLKAHIQFLASDALEGRMTGTAGAAQAAEYLTKQLIELGFEPYTQSYKIPFEFLADLQIPETGNYLQLLLEKGKKATPLPFIIKKEFFPYAFSDTTSFSGPLVFVGYGIKTPPLAKLQYNSYASFMPSKLRDHVHILIDGLPQGLTMEQKEELLPYSSTIKKIQLAKENGAKAVIVLSLKESFENKKYRSRSDDFAAVNCGIPAIRISLPAYKKLVATAGWDSINISTLRQSSLAQADSIFRTHFQKYEPIRISGKVQLTPIKKIDYNIVGVLKPASYSDSTKFLVLGAHYDHLGRGEVASLADEKEAHDIHNGADDNASGVAAVLEIARNLSTLYKSHKAQIKHGVMVGFWAGEELGLLGSNYFVNHTFQPAKKALANFNFDMVGRLKDNKLTIQGTGSSSIWNKLLEKHNIKAGFDLVLSADPYVPTDATSFYTAGSPILSFFTGIHQEYHKPNDDENLINYQGLAKIVTFSSQLCEEILKQNITPDYIKVVSTEKQRKGAATIYLGTIPDYASSEKGMKLSGVKEGGPAAKAGLQGGDIIIKLAGKEINNIYDYMYVLDLLTPNQPVEIVVLRSGKEIKLNVIPTTK
ncbi:MAG: M28 family peptidase [Bacteroidia bacterium]|nr:M28 family peptidase [Bacteroidia bacterium]MDW8159084.1 M28 family peptidase [Bacteroidia bacterium]